MQYEFICADGHSCEPKKFYKDIGSEYPHALSTYPIRVMWHEKRRSLFAMKLANEFFHRKASKSILTKPNRLSDLWR